MYFSFMHATRYAYGGLKYQHILERCHETGLAAAVLSLVISATNSDSTGLSHRFLRVILDLQTGHFGFFLIAFSIQPLQAHTLH